MILEAALPEAEFAHFGLETPLKVQFDVPPPMPVNARPKLPVVVVVSEHDNAWQLTPSGQNGSPKSESPASLSKKTKQPGVFDEVVGPN